MRLANQMIGDDFDLLYTKNTVYMNKYEDISGMKGFPVQQDVLNCAVFSLWYLLVASYEDTPIIDLNPERFRDQLLLYVVCLYLFHLRLQSKLYTFSKTFEIFDILKNSFKKNSNIHEIMTIILIKNNSYKQVPLFKTLKKGVFHSTKHTKKTETFSFKQSYLTLYASTFHQF